MFVFLYQWNELLVLSVYWEVNDTLYLMTNLNILIKCYFLLGVNYYLVENSKHLSVWLKQNLISSIQSYCKQEVPDDPG